MLYSRWWLCGLALAACGTDDGLAGGVQIGEATLYQGPAIPLVRNGELVTTRTAPVLERRRGRLHVALASAGDELRDVTVRFEVKQRAGDPRFVEQVVAIAGQRTDVDIELPADLLLERDDFALSVLETTSFSSSRDSSGARLPEVGSLPLDVRHAPTFRVLVVPTGPTPAPVDQARVQPWHDALEAMLPVTEVEVRISEPVVLNRDLRLDSEWFLLLGDLAAWRASTNVPDDVFVYGVVPPQTMTGIGGIAASLAVEDPYWRVAAGQLSGDANETTIAAHELGHALGRSHAPCGNPGGPDFAYPYADAKIGVPGFDFRTPDELVDPDEVFDILSYCTPVFISDYGFAAAYRSLTSLQDRARPSAPLGDPGFILDRRWLP